MHALDNRSMHSSTVSVASSMSVVSSTLVVTPLPGKGLKLATMAFGDPYVQAGKGFIQPHHSNLPRRRKQPKPTNNDKHDTTPKPPPVEKAQTPDVTASTPVTFPKNELSSLPPPTTASNTTPDVPSNGTKTKGHLQPHVTNLPRRQKKPLTTEQLAVRRRETRERKWCLQEVVLGSGLFVGLSEDEDEDEEEEGEDVYQGYEGVVRVCVRRTDDDETNNKDGRVLRISIPSESIGLDDGIAALSSAQIQSACAFLHRIRSGATSNARTLILSPLARPVDALAIAISCLLSPVSQCLPNLLPGVAYLSDTGRYIDVDSDLPVIDLYRPVHALLMHLHDSSTEGKDDLRAEWRGVMSREGMDELAGMCEPVLEES
ncbi:hypothetical protein BDQ12DRAFT_738571 [Crucibulum laeve]|uniref:Uncharacterized protein n=1 Tax=Crucibulum laeve TaxID=68775 RepID=A0A5C3LM42_9AGAR|nr:hypothetical protein BDQ12DRAFT_738571 [Crucibulum laeve]